MATTTYALERWDLSDLFPGLDSREYEQAGAVIEESLAAFEAERDSRTLFFTLWWRALPEARAQPLLAGPGDYRQWLLNLRREAPYTLSEPEEPIINLKDVTGRHGLGGGLRPPP